MSNPHDVSISLPAFAVWLKTLQDFSALAKAEIKSRLLGKSKAVRDSDWWHHLGHIIDEIFQSGSVNRRYTISTCQDSFDMTLGDIRAELIRLQRNWSDEISVHVSGDTYPEARFSINHMEPQDGLLAIQLVSPTQTKADINSLDELFVAGLAQALRNGKDLGSALSYLADEGYRLADRKSPGWRNRIEP